MVANINRQIRNLGFTVVKYGMPILSINLDIPSDLTIIAKKQIS